MNEEKIKELLSVAFLRLLGNRNGFLCTQPQEDFGVDLMVDRVLAVPEGGSVRYRQNGEGVDFQLKCTTDAGIERSAAEIRYDLAVKNYNDLVARKDDPRPLVLTLLVIPPDSDLWLQDDQANCKLTLQGEGYWFRAADGDATTDNVATKRIAIPLAQRVGLEFLPTLFADVYA